MSVHFVAQPQAHLEMEAQFELLASGTQPLNVIEITLPSQKKFLTRNLRSRLDNHDVSWVPVENSSNHYLLQLDSSWQPKSRHALAVQYTIPALSAADASVHANGCVLGPGWYPILLAPKGMLAKLALNFKKWDLELRVPENFLIHASGRVRSSKKENGEIDLRLQQPVDDVPFIVAGGYRQLAIRASGAKIILWTLEAISVDVAREAGARIAQSMASYDRFLGARLGVRKKSKKPDAIYVVECPYSPLQTEEQAEGQAEAEAQVQAQLQAESPETPNASRPFDSTCKTSLPDTILLPSSVWRTAANREAFQENLNSALAFLWLGDAVASSTARDDLALQGIHEYAAHAVQLNLANDAGSRRALITRYLDAYDKNVHRRTAEPGQSPRSRISALAEEPKSQKSVLFLFALEDQYSPQHLHHAIARMIHVRVEQGYNRNDLRSALESETGQNAANFFHRWLDNYGIPEDFHARYAIDATGQPLKENHP